MARNLRFRNAVLLILGLLFGTFAFGAPAISTISPTVGPVSPVGSALTINGSGFGTTQGASTVSIGGVASVPTSWTDTKIIAPVPSSLLPGFADVIVTSGGTASNTASLLVIPVITAVSPAHAPIGGSVTITGTSFGDAQGTSSTVTFNGLTATPSAWSNTSVSFPIPVGASSGAIVVSVNGWDTNGVNYFISPTISSLSPATGATGGSITINGSGFGATRNFNPVTIGGVSVTPTSWGDTTITIPVPTSLPAGNANVVVTVNSLASNSVGFNVLALSSIALSPANPSVSVNSIQQLQLTAMGLYSDGSSADVTPFVTWATSDRSVAMVLSTPGTRGVVGTANAGTATITANLGGISGSTSVTVTPAAAPTVPNITDVSPATATAGTQVTVTGTGFGSSQGNGSVWLGSTLEQS